MKNYKNLIQYYQLIKNKTGFDDLTIEYGSIMIDESTSLGRSYQ